MGSLSLLMVSINNNVFNLVIRQFNEKLTIKTNLSIGEFLQCVMLRS